MTRRYAARVDTTQRDLTLYMRDTLGLGVELLGGTIDAVVWLGSCVRLVDFKSLGGELQPSQSKLVARGCPVLFVSTTRQADILAAEMRKAVGL